MRKWTTQGGCVIFATKNNRCKLSIFVADNTAEISVKMFRFYRVFHI